MPFTPIEGWSLDHWRHPLYSRWAGIRARCNNPNHAAYSRYGGAGITVCSRWDDFGLFVLDVGMPPSNRHTIDRIKNELGYEPGNCRWSTPGEQSRNTCRNILITHGGLTLTVRDWEIKNGVKRGAYQSRLSRGWPHADVVTQPIHAGKHLANRVRG